MIENLEILIKFLFCNIIDLKNFKLQREALKELENLKVINNELNNKIERQYKKMEV